MNSQQKYLKYKSKYESLKKCINVENNFKKLKQLGGEYYKPLVAQDVIIITKEDSEYKNFYADIIEAWKCCDPNNLLDKCDRELIKSKGLTKADVFRVFQVLIPTKDKDIQVKLNFKDSEVKHAGFFNIEPSDYVSIKKEKCSNNCSPIKCYLLNRMVSNFNTITGQSEQLARITDINDRKIVIGDFYESDFILATRYNYVGQHVKLNLNNFGITDKSKNLYSMQTGVHGIITNIESKLPNRKLCFVTIGSNCVFEYNNNEQLFDEFTKGKLFDYKELISCPIK